MIFRKADPLGPAMGITSTQLHDVVCMILQMDDSAIHAELVDDEAFKSRIADAVDLLRRQPDTALTLHATTIPIPTDVEEVAAGDHTAPTTQLARVRARVEAHAAATASTDSIMEAIQRMDTETIHAYAAMENDAFHGAIEEIIVSITTIPDNYEVRRPDLERLYSILTHEPFATEMVPAQAQMIASWAIDWDKKEFDDVMLMDVAQLQGKVESILQDLKRNNTDLFERFQKAKSDSDERFQKATRADLSKQQNHGNHTARKLFEQKCSSCRSPAAEGQEKCMRCAARGHSPPPHWEQALINLSKSQPSHRPEAAGTTEGENLQTIPGTAVLATKAQAIALAKYSANPCDLTEGIKAFLAKIPEFKNKKHREEFDVVLNTRNAHTVANLLPFMEHHQGLMKLTKSASHIITISDGKGPTLALLKISTLHTGMPKCEHIDLTALAQMPTKSYTADVTTQGGASGVLEAVKHKGRFKTIRANDPMRKTAFAYPCAAELHAGTTLTFSPTDELTVKQALWKAGITEAYFAGRGKARFTSTDRALFQNALSSIKGWSLHNEATWEIFAPEDAQESRPKQRVKATPREDSHDPPHGTVVMLVPVGEKHLISHIVEDLSWYHDQTKYRQSAVPKFHGFFTALVRPDEATTTLPHMGRYGRSIVTFLALDEAMYRHRNGISPDAPPGTGTDTALPTLGDRQDPPQISTPSAVVSRPSEGTTPAPLAAPVKAATNATEGDNIPKGKKAKIANTAVAAVTPPRKAPKQSGATPTKVLVPKLAINQIGAKERRALEKRTEIGPLPRTALPDNNRYAALAETSVPNNNPKAVRQRTSQNNTPDPKRRTTPRVDSGGGTTH